MSRKINLPIPAKKALLKLGRDISDARKRRRITMELMAERAGLSRTTLDKIEKGEPTVLIGAYVSVLFVLGMTDRLQDLVDARHDVTGRELEDENLPKRVRPPQNTHGGRDE